MLALHDFGDAARADASIQALTQRVHVTVDPQCEADYPRLRAAKVRLVTQDGRQIERYVPEPYGAASNPLSDAALEAKFLDLAAPRIGQDSAAAGLRALWQVETLLDMRSLAEGLAFSG